MSMCTGRSPTRLTRTLRSQHARLSGEEMMKLWIDDLRDAPDEW